MLLLMSGKTVLGHVNCTKWAACCCWLGYPILKWNGDTQITASHIRPSVSKASKLWNSLCTNTDYEFLFWIASTFVHDRAFEIFREFGFWWTFTLNYIEYIQIHPTSIQLNMRNSDSVENILSIQICTKIMSKKNFNTKFWKHRF